jgi:hypothetical protein
VRCDGVVADGVDPGVAGAQGYDGLDHAGSELLQGDKDQRQRGIARVVKTDQPSTMCMAA